MTDISWDQTLRREGKAGQLNLEISPFPVGLTVCDCLDAMGNGSANPDSPMFSGSFQATCPFDQANPSFKSETALPLTSPYTEGRAPRDELFHNFQDD